MALTIRRLSCRMLLAAAVAGIVIVLAGRVASNSDLDDSDIEVDLSGAGAHGLEASNCVSLAASAGLRNDGDSIPRLAVRVDRGEQTSAAELMYEFSGVTSATDGVAWIMPGHAQWTSASRGINLSPR